MMKCIFTLLVYMGVVYAGNTDLGVFQAGHPIQLQFTCRINSYPCYGDETAKIWLIYENTTPIVTNTTINNANGIYFYDIQNTTLIGSYYGYVRFTDGDMIGQEEFNFNIGSTYNKIDFMTCPSTNSMIFVLAIAIGLSMLLIYMGFKYRQMVLQLFGGLIVVVLSPTLGACNMYLGTIIFVIGLLIMLMSLYYITFR